MLGEKVKFPVCLKMSKQMKREKKVQLTMFTVLTGQVDSVYYFCFVDINRTKK